MRMIKGYFSEVILLQQLMAVRTAPENMRRSPEGRPGLTGRSLNRS